MKAFDSKEVPLQGVNLIEASAGTGKTYTLAELYVRLILEKDITVNQILVVTYTRAATQELRHRLRLRLAEARDQCLIKKSTQQQKALNKLNRAIQSFDEAAIFTIHSFCQRALVDYAFESGLSFDWTLINDDYELLQSVVDDFWRKRVTTADKEFVSFLLAKNETIDTLLQSVRSIIDKPYLQLLPVLEVDGKSCLHETKTQFDKVKTLWLEQKEEVVATLTNIYRHDWAKKWLSELELWLKAPMLPPDLPNRFDKFTFETLQIAANKKRQTLPDIDFWAACEDLQAKYQKLKQDMETWRQKLRFDLLIYLRKTLPQRKRDERVLSYDDLLINLNQAMKGDRGKRLIGSVQNQYQAVLIDEFQDTDPIQYDNFYQLFIDSGVTTFLVGDPKQAIYSFRGADVFTYLQAKRAVKASHQYALMTNWRSHPDLIAAINHIFSRQSVPFIYDDIPFHQVGGADKKHRLKTDEDNKPLQIVWQESNSQLTKQAFTNFAAQIVADEIARLLNAALAGKTALYDHHLEAFRSITGDDIAVLVRTHRQADDVAKCLRDRGINSVKQSAENVFSSQQAIMLARVLAAIADPSNETKIRIALITTIWGMSASELFTLQQDEKRWADKVNIFYELHQVWLQYGFIRLFRQLLTSLSVQQRLLTLTHGERYLTDLLHLAELIQDYCHQHGDNMYLALKWLLDQMQIADSHDDNIQLRLESDEQLVKIVTIHKSKGLEYPIVFCPFLWDVSLRSKENKVISFHDETGGATAFFAQSDKATEAATKEERAEALRLLYVALTRARERCVIVWGHAKGVDQSALFSLLHPALAQPNSDAMTADLLALAKDSMDVISMRMAHHETKTKYQQKADDKQVLSAVKFKGKIDKPWRIGSFTSLTSDHVALFEDDELSSAYQPSDLAPLLSRFTFPRGIKTGHFLHALFELWDFTRQDDKARRDVVAHTLLQYGFESKWLSVVDGWLQEVIATPLDKRGFSLSNLTPAKRLNELRFYFSVASLSLSLLRQQLLPLLAADSPLAMTLHRIHFSDLTGFMTGSIDLVFEHQGQFYVADYKSNYLGSDSAYYHENELRHAMIKHHYPWQYLIYSLALHRYLKLRMPHYDPTRHLGGVYYLFIRGIKPDWGRAGIFYDAPHIDVLEKLDNLLAGRDG